MAEATEIKLNIDQGQIKQLVAEGLLAQLTEEMRTDLLKQAVAFLLQERRVDTGYSSKTEPAPIVAAFNQAAEWSVREIAREMIDGSPEYGTQVRTLVSDSLKKLMDDDYDMRRIVGEHLGEALVDAVYAEKDKRY